MEGLPSEIRARIFSNLIPNEQIIEVCKDRPVKHCKPIAVKTSLYAFPLGPYRYVQFQDTRNLLLVSKMFRDECAIILYGQNKFRMRSCESIRYFLNMLGSQTSQYIRHLEIEPGVDILSPSYFEIWRDVLGSVNHLCELTTLHLVNGGSRGFRSIRDINSGSKLDGEDWQYLCAQLVQMTFDEVVVLRGGTVYQLEGFPLVTICRKNSRYKFGDAETEVYLSR